MGEVVVEALLAWAFEGKTGDIILATTINHVPHQCCLSLPEITSRDVSRIRRLPRVEVAVEYNPSRPNP